MELDWVELAKYAGLTGVVAFVARYLLTKAGFPTWKQSRAEERVILFLVCFLLPVAISSLIFATEKKLNDSNQKATQRAMENEQKNKENQEYAKQKVEELQKEKSRIENWLKKNENKVRVLYVYEQSMLVEGFLDKKRRIVSYQFGFPLCVPNEVWTAKADTSWNSNYQQERAEIFLFEMVAQQN